MSQVLITILYPSSKTSEFNIDYYKNKHMPTVANVWGPMGLKKWTLYTLNKETGYVAKCVLVFSSEEAFNKAVASEDSREVMADMKNYCDVQPVILVGKEEASG
ncbi:hypothetical protein LTR66_000029 [Elasticomyces elasticus]|nr:hypothetical protein LTR50_001455 [Elasticomyces elasticus]KAK5001253.1 hypothetical protein LTR66_000029 [Elasticomyces elasticus]